MVAIPAIVGRTDEGADLNGIIDPKSPIMTVLNALRLNGGDIIGIITAPTEKNSVTGPLPFLDR
jgi:hypothetical protein